MQPQGLPQGTLCFAAVDGRARTDGFRVGIHDRSGRAADACRRIGCGHGCSNLCRARRRGGTHAAGENGKGPTLTIGGLTTSDRNGGFQGAGGQPPAFGSFLPGERDATNRENSTGTITIDRNVVTAVQNAMESEASGVGTGALSTPSGFKYGEGGLQSAISGVMGFASRVVEHEALIHFGAFANGSGPVTNNDNVNISAFGIPIASLERGAVYEMAAYGNVGSTTNSGYGIFSQYNYVQNQPSVEPGHTQDRQRRAAEFKLQKSN